MSASAVNDSSGTEQLAPGALVARRYRVVAHLGSGGMGAVYRAEHVHMRKTVALKVLHREFLAVDEVVARFEREAIAAARIEHPNVVAASDFGKLEDGSFYLVLEFVDGTSLRSLLEKQGPLHTVRALRIVQQTLLALEAAHRAGVVHRDLKPDNVMLMRSPDGTDRVKVLDFGIARVAAPNARHDATKLTQVGVVMGTVAYMSPEQATGQPVDERSDLYSLGVMFYEMLAGRVPFDAELPSQVLARQLVEEPPPLPPGTSPALAQLIFDLMRKKAEERPASAREVLERIAELTATPSGRVVAPRRLPSRAVLIGAGAALLLLVFAVFAFSARTDEPMAASAEPALSQAPSALASAPLSPVESVAPAAVSVAPAAAVAAPSATPRTEAPAKSAVTASKSSKSTPSKTKEQKSPAPAPAPTAKRKTGPGGIYIPPPSTWFK